MACEVHQSDPEASEHKYKKHVHAVASTTTPCLVMSVALGEDGRGFSLPFLSPSQLFAAPLTQTTTLGFDSESRSLPINHGKDIVFPLNIAVKNANGNVPTGGGDLRVKMK